MPLEGHLVLIDIREGSIFSNNRTSTVTCNRNKLSRQAAGNNYFASSQFNYTACGQKTKFLLRLVNVHA